MASLPRAVDQELLKRLESFDLIEEKDDPTLLNDNNVCEGVEECRNSCYGRIFSLREIPLKFLQLSMAKAWKNDHLKIIRIKQSLY